MSKNLRWIGLALIIVLAASGCAPMTRLVIRKYRGRDDEVVSVADLRRPKRVILIAEK